MKWKQVRLEAENIMYDAEKLERPNLDDLPAAMKDFHTVAVLLGVAMDQLEYMGAVFPAHNPAKRIQEILSDGLAECEKQRFVLTRAHKGLKDPFCVG